MLVPLRGFSTPNRGRRRQLSAADGLCPCAGRGSVPSAKSEAAPLYRSTVRIRPVTEV